MNIRDKALPWFIHNCIYTDELVKTSKYYIESESWTKSDVWWFEFNVSDVIANLNGYTNLVCEKVPNDGNSFHHLRVPNRFFSENKELLFRREKKGSDVFSIYLSALDDSLFVEQKGSGKVDFSKCVQEI